MNIPPETLEQLILERLCSKAGFAGYDMTSKTWRMRAPAAVSDAVIAQLQALPGCGVVETARADGVVYFDVRFTKPPRLAFGE